MAMELRRRASAAIEGDVLSVLDNVSLEGKGVFKLAASFHRLCKEAKERAFASTIGNDRFAGERKGLEKPRKKSRG